MFTSIIYNQIDFKSFIVCTLCSIVLGAVIAASYLYKNKYSKSFIVTLALLPAIVQMVIMMVNGNLGVGVAVAGAFSLIRFRSATGSAKEIVTVFLSMATGLATGMGYCAMAVMFVVIIVLVMILYNSLKIGEGTANQKQLKITIPENLNYSEVFQDIFCEYTTKHELLRVKTSNLGSLYKLDYIICLTDTSKEKEFIDALRCRNGNLEISCGMVESGQELF